MPKNKYQYYIESEGEDIEDASVLETFLDVSKDPTWVAEEAGQHYNDNYCECCDVSDGDEQIIVILDMDGNKLLRATVRVEMSPDFVCEEVMDISDE